MKSKQWFKLLFGLGMGLLLLIVTLWLPIRAVRSQSMSESEREEAMALAAEQGTNPHRIIPSVLSAGVAPLFVGIDSLTTSAYTIDVDTNTFYTAYVGLETSAAAYDPNNGRVLIMDGTQMWEWPIGGTPNFLGNVTYQGGSITLLGLTYYNGTLYGARTVGTEGIYTVDLSTLEATLIITYADPPNSVDIGGIEIDPATGLLYAVNDGTGQPGLVLINGDGTLTPVAPYLGGEDDVDGLAISEGKAYLITDDPTPPYFNVYDLVAGTYITTVANPWTSTELYAGGAWIEGVVFTPTINVYPTAIDRDLLSNAVITMLMNIDNIGSGSLIWQIVEQGVATAVAPFAWGNWSAKTRPSAAAHGGCTPGDIPWLNASPTSGIVLGNSYDLVTVTLDATGYMAGVYTGTLCVESNDAATPLVQVPVTMTVFELPAANIVLSKTVGTEMGVCALNNVITVTEGTAVNYCYQVTNTGGVTLPLHTLQDSALGDLLLDFPYELAPGQSAQVQVSTTPTASITNTATWMAFTDQFVTFADPISDTIGFSTPQHDINQVSLTSDGQVVTVTVSFTGPISPTGSGSPYTVVGYLELDADLNQSTGGIAIGTFFCPASGNVLGVDYIVDMYNYNPMTGQADFRTFEAVLVGVVDVTFTNSSFTAVIPTDLMNNNGVVRLTGLLGTFAEPTDCVPNGGFVSNEIFTAVATASAFVTVTPLPPEPMTYIYLPVILKP